MNILDHAEASVRINNAFAGRYNTLQLIGEGGMGAVYLIETSDRFAMRWACKILSKSDYRPDMNIYAEAEALTGLDHPCIPRVIEVAEDDRYVYIVQELVEGQSIREIVQKNGVIPNDIVIMWMSDVADALAYLHSHGIIHRDIKPTNIMITNEGKVKLIDFGLAKSISYVDAADNRVIGTRNYTPPERYRGLPADVRTDIYEYGTTFYSVATGIVPLEMSSNSRRHMVTMRRNLSSIQSPGLRAILSKCIDVDPNKRYQDFNEIFMQIKAIDVMDIEVSNAEKKRRSLIALTAVTLVLGLILTVSGIIMSVNDHNSYYDDIVRKARNSFDEGDTEKAAELADKAISFDSTRTEALQVKYEAMTYEAEKADDDRVKRKYKKIAADLEDDIGNSSKAEEDASLNYLLGNAYYELGLLESGDNAKDLYRKAEKRLKKAVSIEPNVDRYLVLGLTYCALHKYSKAEKSIKNLKDIEEGSAHADYLLAQVYFEKDEYDKAVKQFRKVIRSKSENRLRRMAYTELAQLYLDIRQDGDAVDVLKQAADDKKIKDKYKILLMLGDTQYNTGNFRDAISSYEDLLDIAESAYAYSALISCCLQLSDTDSAISYAVKMEKKYPEDCRGYMLHAQALVNRHPSFNDFESKSYVPDYKQFMKLYDKSKKLYDRDPKDGSDGMMATLTVNREEWTAAYNDRAAYMNTQDNT